jgi:hypothetical protein
MNLARHAAVLWRFRAVAATGLALGLLLAVLASYSVSFDGGPSLERRGVETWTSVSRILVTQPGFPEGRVTLPQKQIDNAVTADGAAANEKMAAPGDQVEFADPARLGALADLYSRFLTSSEVRSAAPERPEAGQVVASPYQAASGGQIMPIIELATSATTGPGSRALNLHMFEALENVLAKQQRRNQIPKAKRVEIKIIDAPVAGLTSGHKPTASVLALLVALLGTVAVCHLLAAIRGQQQPEDGQLAAIVDWAAPSEPQNGAGRSGATRPAEPIAATGGGTPSDEVHWAGWQRQ